VNEFQRTVYESACSVGRSLRLEVFVLAFRYLFSMHSIFVVVLECASNDDDAHGKSTRAVFFLACPLQ
jgi:hypothetical protein